jgi:flavin-dependent dehydrogenase
VVIVGGGPAGTTTAIALTHAAPELASRVLVLEKARYPREKPCAGALGRRGDRLLESIGARLDVPGVPIDGMSLGARSGFASASPGGIGRVIRRTEFDHALALDAKARGVEVREGVRVARVDEQGAAAVVATDAGLIRARVVVGADGVGSVVRKSLGLGAGGWRAQVVEVDTETVAGDPPRSILHFDATDPGLAGYAWDFPTLVQGRPLVCRGVYRLKGPGASSEGPDVGDLLAARLKRQGIAPSSCHERRYAERGFEPAATLAHGCRMLVGEAAGIDPVTGEGIAQAIEFGVLAGQFLARALAAAPSGPVTLSPWQDEVGRSRLARDLRIRTRLLHLFYGPSRPEVERFLTESPDALRVGSRHFAAQPHDWPELLEVLVRGGASLAGMKVRELLARG